MIKLKQHPKYDTIVSWGKLISITGSAQIIIQAVTFASGILIIHLLSVKEYAFYTLCNTMLGAMIVLSDSGISTGVMSLGGESWQDKEKLGTVLATGLELRRKYALLSLLVTIPILFYLLLHNGASWLVAFLITLAMIPAFYAALSDSLLEIVPKLHQKIYPLQRNQIEVGIVRLFLSAITVFFFPLAFVAILAGGIPRIIGNVRLRKIVYGITGEEKESDPEIRRKIIDISKRTLPSVIYYCFSGQINIWIISYFGNTTSLAQLGALSRVVMLLSLISVVFSVLIVPRFARLKNDYSILIAFYTKMIILIVFISILVIITLCFLSEYFLYILGHKYLGLDKELILVMIGGCINMIMASGLSLYMSKGWVMKHYISVGFSILPLIVGCLIFDISDLVGVLYFNIFVAITEMIVHVGYGFYRINLLRNKQAE
ncbi:lipopolysaccharide biosynthesis protein [Flavobacterium chungbukense]|uniref:Polysaccharide biosynthesis protein n=1 Tax=Flavobacterium chungbukense TaxID=877464 RepID=A0ABP7YIH1_9FLAO|nr:oligosaccharide flippase family protein [Flavobacterium chungbukense]MCC4920179.1 oligosaccharide flippase family protein [Flavobacterium chungbukense]